MKNLKPKKSTRLALKKLAKGLRPKGLRPKGLRPKRSKKAIAKTFGQESPYIPDHDKLIDQIVRELNDLGASIRRIMSCCDALPRLEKHALKTAFFEPLTLFQHSRDAMGERLAKQQAVSFDALEEHAVAVREAREKPAKRPSVKPGELPKSSKDPRPLSLGQVRNLVETWRKIPIKSMSFIDLQRDRRMLEQVWEDERVYMLVTGEPDLPVAVYWREILEEAAKLVQKQEVKEDLHLTEKSKTKVRAGAPTILLTDMMKNYGLKPTPKNLKAEMGRRLDARKQAVLDEFGWLHLADFDGQLAKWKKRGQVFSVLEPEGRMSKAQHRRLTRNDEIFLLFQFTDGKPIKVVKKIIEAFGHKKDPWKLALWFTSNNGWLPDQARPVDLLGTRPKAVVAAARRDAGGQGSNP